MRRHLFIPDVQVTPDTPNDHLVWISKYIIDKKPDVIVQIGDFADMESLSSYDKGKISFEGRRYNRDVEAANTAFKILNSQINKYNNRQRKNKKKLYSPEMHLTLGNHENRIDRAISENPILEGTISTEDLCYKEMGWVVHDFLKPVVIDGLHYCHYFYNRQSGRPLSGENIMLRLKNVGFSFVQGHQQIYTPGIRELNNGERHRGLVCGACYLHAEDYRGPQAGNEWRGVFLLNEVENGDYVLNEVSLDYLCRRYEGVEISKYVSDKYPDLDSPYNKQKW